MTRLERFVRNIPQDKLLHVLAGTLIYGAVAALLAPVNGLAAAVFGGVVKEVYDELRYGGWDSMDLLATIIGGFIGAAITGLT